MVKAAVALSVVVVGCSVERPGVLRWKREGWECSLCVQARKEAAELTGIWGSQAAASRAACPPVFPSALDLRL